VRLELEGRVAIVTGAASGIGRETARLFAREGAHLVLGDLNAARLDELAAELRQRGAKCEPVTCNTTHEEEVTAMVRTAVSTFGRVDILVHSAGIRENEKPLTETTLDDWNRLVETNLTGTFLCIKHSVAAMLETGGGSIVTMASISGLRGDPRYSAYAASKAGVISLTRSVAAEFAKKGIRVNCVCPGYVETPMLDIFTQNSSVRASFVRNLQPLGRLAKPEEIAEAALYFASDRASFATGSVLTVDGGLLA